MRQEAKEELGRCHDVSPFEVHWLKVGRAPTPSVPIGRRDHPPQVQSIGEHPRSIMEASPFSALVLTKM